MNNKIKIKMVSLFSGVGMQERGVENTDCFELESIGTSEIDIDAIIAYAAVHNGLTPALVENYEGYPDRQTMANDLIEKNIGFDFVKGKPYDWNKIAKSKDSKELLKKTWLACKLNNNLGDIAKVDELPKCGLVTFSFPCFTADTKIRTQNGLKKIVDIKLGDWVLTKYNTYQLVTKTFYNGYYSVGDLLFDDEYKVSCTPNHKFLCVDNGIYYWKTAEKLMPYDKVKTDIGYKHIVSYTNFRIEEVYDIEVGNTHQFCLENGVIVHNCTDISISGKQSGFDEGQTRSGLVWEVIRILKNMKEDDALPNFLLMENVDALVSKKFLSNYKKLNEEFKKLGYECKWQIINGKNCGVPQNRKRVFGLYYLADKIDLSKFEFPLPFDKGIRLKDVLEEEVDEKYYLKSDKAQQLIEQLVIDGKVTEEDFL